MSFLSDELERQITAHDITGLELADRTGISSSQIYNWIKSVQVSITEDRLKLLQAALSDDPRDHAMLVMAHLLDEKFGFQHELITIDIKESAGLKDHQRRMAKGEKAIHYLAELRLKSKDCNDLLVDLAKILGAELIGLFFTMLWSFGLHPIGLLAEILALVFGFMSRSRRLGKIALIGAGIYFFIVISILSFLIISILAEVNPHQ